MHNQHLIFKLFLFFFFFFFSIEASTVFAQNLTYTFNRNDSLCCDSLVVKQGHQETIHYFYTKDQSIYCVARRKFGKIHGSVKQYSSEGKLSSISHYKNGLRHGPLKIYTYAQNRRKVTHSGTYWQGKKHGTFVSSLYPKDSNYKRYQLSKYVYFKGEFQHGIRSSIPYW